MRSRERYVSRERTRTIPREGLCAPGGRFSVKARSRKHPRTHSRVLRKQIKTSGRLETADGTVISCTFYVRFARLEGRRAWFVAGNPRPPFSIPTRRRYRGREIDGFDAPRNWIANRLEGERVSWFVTCSVVWLIYSIGNELNNSWSFQEKRKTD